MLLQWTELAADDLDNIEIYIAENVSPAVAIDVVINVIDSVDRVLGNQPRAGRMGRVKGTREWVVDGVPFTVVYRYLEPGQLVQILRVLHQAQQWLD